MKTVLTLVIALFATSVACVSNDLHAQTQSNSNQPQQQEDAAAKAEQLQIAVQKICPVSGGELGSMGEPVKVKVGEQVAFLCCKGCQGKPLNVEHWKTVQANIAAAQGTCPIMNKPVTADMKSTVVNGQQVFVCCPPCIAKIQADAEVALKKVNSNYASYIAKQQQAKSDQLFAAAQGICPVSGGKLGSMGEPVKVKVGEQIAYLCCKGCQGKKIDPEHWKTVQANLAKAQGTCPVMEKPVDATMKSTLVQGRKVFVCCPPCISKIEADPATFLAKLEAQIAQATEAADSEADDQ